MSRTFQTKARHRLAVVIVALAIAVGAIAGVAFARARTAPPVGTGVVVIDTNLAYSGGQAAGTGMVLTSSGEILTNNHVIKGATTIEVVLPGTGRKYVAHVVGYDVSDDVAVLKTVGASNLKTVSLADSSKVKVGQSVTATGNAGGSGVLTSTTGSVTGVARAITVSDESGGSESLAGLIETNAELQPGDSGGPLFNAAKKVIGMDTAAEVSQYGYGQTVSSTDGYAIPISKAITIAKKIDAGKASSTIHVGATAFLGVSIGSGYDGSIVVAATVPNGPAANAGIVAGDELVSLDGHAITSAAQVGSVMASEQAGKSVAVTYLDQTGATQTATVTLGSGPPQ